MVGDDSLKHACAMLAPLDDRPSQLGGLGAKGLGSLHGWRPQYACPLALAQRARVFDTNARGWRLYRPKQPVTFLPQTRRDRRQGPIVRWRIHDRCLASLPGDFYATNAVVFTASRRLTSSST